VKTLHHRSPEIVKPKVAKCHRQAPFRSFGHRDMESQETFTTTEMKNVEYQTVDLTPFWMILGVEVSKFEMPK
jgi:hypothetical protein